MQSTTTNPQNALVAPIIPTEGVSEAGTTDGIDVPSSESVAPEQGGALPELALEQPEQQQEQGDGEQQKAKPTPKGNFITKYQEYADVVEVPADAHEAIAMAILAAVLNRNDVYIQHGAVPIPMDFWLILMSESGAGRNTLVGLASPILKKAGLEDLVRKSAWGSEVALYQNFAENPSGLFIWPELSIILKKFAQPNFGGAKVWMTDTYDNPGVPDAITYRRTGRKDTPPIEFTQAPRLNIIATSSEDWLMTNLVQEDTTGGFLPRFLLIKLDAIEKDVPIPRDTDPRLKYELAEQLRFIDTIRGTVTLSEEVQAEYDRWYRKTKKRFLAQPNPALARPFFNRLRNQVLKLAVIHEVAESQTLNISVESLKKAIKTAAKIEETIFTLLPTGMNREGAELLKIEQRIKEGKADGVSQTVLTRAFQSTPRSERTQRIQTLCQGGAVVSFRRETGGRTAIVYVHKEYADDHRTKCPNDQG
jgi:hypothetical protein